MEVQPIPPSTPSCPRIPTHCGAAAGSVFALPRSPERRNQHACGGPVEDHAVAGIEFGLVDGQRDKPAFAEVDEGLLGVRALGSPLLQATWSFGTLALRSVRQHCVGTPTLS